jgi:mycothiol synthase
VNVRAATEDDLEAIRRLLAEDEERLLGRPSRIELGDLREWLSRTDLAADSWLIEDDGRACAVAWCIAPPGGDVIIAIGVVRSGWKGRGLGSQLVDCSEQRARELGGRRLHQMAFARDAAAASLFSARGYREIRRFYDMAIELDERPAAVDVPIETLREVDARAFHAALDEAFQDHWEHHSTPFEDWWERHSANPGFDPSLWFLIRDGDEIAAVSRNEANRNGGGYVAAIGVRRAYRGRGYAKALLLHTFGEFYDRGVPRVTLGVDAESPTGATHLYERVGMHVELENVVFEKALA